MTPRPSDTELDTAVRALRAGRLVAFPTETVYGLGADASNPDAVSRVFAVKGRPTSHPLIVHLASAAAMPAWADPVPEAAQRLAERFWPGPLTIVLRRGSRTPLAVTGGHDTVALRVPAHPVALALLERFGGGLAAPSANRFGSVSPTTAQHVRDDLGTDVDVVLDGGACAVGVESTIVDLSGDAPVLLRPGGVTREDLESVLGCALSQGGARTVAAPGQHPSHYAPHAQVRLVPVPEVANEVRALLAQGQRVGVWAPADVPAAELAGAVVRTLPATLDEQAHELYEVLRAFDRDGCTTIVACLPPEHGLGLALADRLRKAAGPRPA
ncbi:MAG: hypothetical protein RL721_923 [Candidatus Eisenbacteria bacterium]